jgi:hypothetical protein
VGIHFGPVRIKDDDIYGLMVNYAARLSHVHVPGEEGIFLSDSAKANIEAEYGNTQTNFGFRQLANATLKGFSSNESVWDVITPEIREARMKRMRAKAQQNQSTAPSPTAAPVLITPEKPMLTLGQRRFPLKDPTEGPRRK